MKNEINIGYRIVHSSIGGLKDSHVQSSERASKKEK